jgi:hypothetical protein
MGGVQGHLFPPCVAVPQEVINLPRTTHDSPPPPAHTAASLPHHPPYCCPPRPPAVVWCTLQEAAALLAILPLWERQAPGSCGRLVAELLAALHATSDTPALSQLRATANALFGRPAAAAAGGGGLGGGLGAGGGLARVPSSASAGGISTGHSSPAGWPAGVGGGGKAGAGGGGEGGGAALAELGPLGSYLMQQWMADVARQSAVVGGRRGAWG